MTTTVKTKRFARTPRITADTITGSELLMEIRKIVLAEPKRANLSTWIKALSGVHPYGRKRIAGLPACGTVACLAGWGAVLLRPRTAVRKLHNNAYGVMRELVGIGHDPRHRDEDGLFYCGPLPDYGETAESLGTPGTQKHAEAIANRITRYLERYPEVAARQIDVKYARSRLQA